MGQQQTDLAKTLNNRLQGIQHLQWFILSTTRQKCCLCMASFVGAPQRIEKPSTITSLTFPVSLTAPMN